MNNKSTELNEIFTILIESSVKKCMLFVVNDKKHFNLFLSTNLIANYPIREDEDSFLKGDQVKQDLIRLDIKINDLRILVEKLSLALDNKTHFLFKNKCVFFDADLSYCEFGIVHSWEETQSFFKTNKNYHLYDQFKSNH